MKSLSNNLTKITYTSSYINDTTVEQRIYIVSSKGSLIIKKEFHTNYYESHLLIDSLNNSLFNKELKTLDKIEIAEFLINESFWVNNIKVDKQKWKPIGEKIMDL